MLLTGRSRSGRRLQGIFLAVTVLPTAGLNGLGWQLVRLDRSLAASQIEDRLEVRLAFGVLKNSIEIWAEKISSLIASRGR